jgi:pimeloyl-ACP methyl ester carboxylesterase
MSKTSTPTTPARQHLWSDGTRWDTMRLARRWSSLDRRLIEGTRSGIEVLELSTTRLRIRSAGTGVTTLVFICDPPNVVEQYDDLIAILGAKHRIVVVEAPGFGFSFPKRNFTFGLEAYADAYVELLRQLDMAPYVLVAPCISVFAALLTAKRYPAGITKLVLMQATAWAAQKAWVEQVAKSFSVGVLGMPFGDRIGAVPYIGQALFSLTEAWFPQLTHRFAVHHAAERPALLAKFMQAGSEAFRHGACNCMPSLYQKYFSGDDARFSGAAQPALVLWATQDYWHDTRGVHETWPAVRGRLIRAVMDDVSSDNRGLLRYVPDAQFSEIAGTGHHLELENAPEVCRLIEAFVDAS